MSWVFQTAKGGAQRVHRGLHSQPAFCRDKRNGKSTLCPSLKHINNRVGAIIKIDFLFRKAWPIPSKHRRQISSCCLPWIMILWELIYVLCASSFTVLKGLLWSHQRGTSDTYHIRLSQLSNRRKGMAELLSPFSVSMYLDRLATVCHNLTQIDCFFITI